MIEAHLVDDIGRHRTAPEQMATDAALMANVAGGGPPALRLYTWTTPALTLGRFQPDDDVDRRACTRHGIDVARRPSGGRALLHGADLTYAVAMPDTGAPVATTYRRVAQALIDGLARLGVDCEVIERGGRSGAACFTGAAGADLRIGGRKLCGSAMVRRGGAWLQHGSILRDRLDVDESDVLVGTDRDELRAKTVTLAELGATTSADEVASALVEGFRAALDLDLHLTSRISLPDTGAGRTLRG